jgi:hypothetical protein
MMVKTASWTRIPGAKFVGAVALLLGVGLIASSCSSSPPSHSSQVPLTITPAHGSASGPYRSGELLNIKVGPNKLFTPLLKVNILECADPGGTAAHMPKSIADCDGDTIQGGTILINRNGSFSQTGYQVFSLPNAVLGEQSNGQPICDLTHECVLYIGQNQEDFTQPKIFSAPFTVKPVVKR